ncbi:hypothetical protein CHGG_03445 [Chaetomium globosum CBS 148.51]|uniref:EH domain-containing protein n=1 Tax=Chaetomium globosum (strain ATCC 6205 / CBS 148.51 / DSM 1962 / NBRC 6347 / NRRL 1970) TaxID=306901 RepID=Q2H8K9_CHAGB|nr:uncharacterized protein CHGG_03445 [Chaetomium globosum CBS 148.51]EAQ91510.1 hypothetical protein CHGG_03445 [Chaetomium globosum CBS 148.51]
MIVRDLKRLTLVVGPLVVLLLLSVALWHSRADYVRSHVGALLNNDANTPAVTGLHRKPKLTANETHYEIFSASSTDGRFFDINFGRDVFNPNIIPHQKINNTWHVVGQLYTDANSDTPANEAYEFGCVAQFINGVLMCIDYVRPMPYQPSPGGKCVDNLSLYNLAVGPHDARVFFGPQNPLTIYGSNGGHTCFGQFIRDFRKMVDWEYELMTNTDFEDGTEIVRPPPFFPMEKNYFVFWDKDNEMHVHYDAYPKRGYAKLERDGSTGPELATKTAKPDEKCLQRYLPKLPAELESIHQATNSLKITLCNRADKKCEAHDGNTYIMTIIQHKTYYDYHSEYDPYVMLFQQRAPYELYGISKKPLWISGRKHHKGRRTDMMYVTSANWKDRGVNYHGYLDDIVFLGFGFEDKHAGGIDVHAGDLLVDLGLCEQP